LIKKDDSHIDDYFEKIKKEYPDESPICLLNKIFQIGMTLFDISIDEKPSHENITDLRKDINNFYTEILKIWIEKLFEKDHECKGI